MRRACRATPRSRHTCAARSSDGAGEDVSYRRSDEFAEQRCPSIEPDGKHVFDGGDRVEQLLALKVEQCARLIVQLVAVNAVTVALHSFNAAVEVTATAIRQLLEISEGRFVQRSDAIRVVSVKTNLE